MSNEIDFRNVTEAEAYDYGQGAYWCTNHNTLNDNPYPVDTLQYKSWAAGYIDALNEDTE